MKKGAAAACLVLGLLFGISVDAIAAREPAAQPQRVCLVRVVDIGGGLASVRRLRKALERALREAEDFDLVPMRSWARAARRRGIPSQRWLRRSSLRKVGRALKLDAVMTARMRRSRRRYRLDLTVTSVASGRRLARRQITLRRPVLSLSKARNAVAMLGWRLTVGQADRPSPADAPARPVEAKAAPQKPPRSKRPSSRRSNRSSSTRQPRWRRNREPLHRRRTTLGPPPRAGMRSTAAALAKSR